jgi:hypothetical protein
MVWFGVVYGILCFVAYSIIQLNTNLTSLTFQLKFWDPILHHRRRLHRCHHHFQYFQTNRVYIYVKNNTSFINSPRILIHQHQNESSQSSLLNLAETSVFLRFNFSKIIHGIIFIFCKILKNSIYKAAVIISGGKRTKTVFRIGLWLQFVLIIIEIV